MDTRPCRAHQIRGARRAGGSGLGWDGVNKGTESSKAQRLVITGLDCQPEVSTHNREAAGGSERGIGSLATQCVSVS